MSKKFYYNGYYALRWQILERDNFTCQYCGQSAPNVKLEVDHKIPREEGGNDNPENLITSCYACNRGKSGLSIIRKRKAKKMAKPFSPVNPQSFRQDEALNIISQSDDGISAIELAQKINIRKEYAYTVIHRLKQKQLIIKKDDKWYHIT